MAKHSNRVTITAIQSENDLQIIHGYGDGGFRISGNRFSGSGFVAPPYQIMVANRTRKANSVSIIDLAPAALPPCYCLVLVPPRLAHCNPWQMT